MQLPVDALNSDIGRRYSHHPFNILLAVLDKQWSLHLLIDFRAFWYNPKAFEVRKEETIPETFLKYAQIRFLLFKKKILQTGLDQ